MFRVCTFIENGSFENEWDYALSNLSPDELHLIGINGFEPTNNAMRDKPLLANCDGLPDAPIVIVAPLSSRNFPPTKSLLDFTHPDDAIYLFGPNNQHVTEEDLAGRKPQHIIHIPTDTKDEMFNYMAYLITAWHRRYG